MTTVTEAIDSFVLSLRVEGRSQATLSSYGSIFRGLKWYADSHDWPDMAQVTTVHMRKFLVYLQETDHRFGSNHLSAQKPLKRSTVRLYYRILSSLCNWLQREGIIESSPLAKIKAPKVRHQVVHALNVSEIRQIVASFDGHYEGVRNKAIVLMLTDCGLRLGELVGLRMADIDLNTQILKVTGKTGERLARFGSVTATALSDYLALRDELPGQDDRLWLIKKGTGLKLASVETMFASLAKRTRIDVHAHLLRHTMATMWLRNGGDSIQLMRLLGHTTLQMTTRYVQAVSCEDAIRSHVKYSPVDNLARRGVTP